MGPGGVDRIVFRPATPVPAHINAVIAQDDIATSSSGALTLRLGGSRAADTLGIGSSAGFAGGILDASAVIFDASWTQGVDRLVLYGSEGDDTLIGSSGSDWFVVSEGRTPGRDSVVGGEGVDTLAADFFEVPGAFVSEGSSGLTSDWGTSIRWSGIEQLQLVLGQGDDSVLGLAGADTLNGFHGNDTLSGAGGNDYLNGDIGNDVLRGGRGSDSLQGLDGHDKLFGDDGADRLDGFRGNDTLYGGNGDDTLNGRFDRDTLYGDAGNDTFVMDGTGDQAFGGAGTDTVQSSISFTLAPDASIENLTLTGADTINGYGNQVANRITGNSKENTIRGGEGGDTISVGGDDREDVLIIRNAAESMGSTYDRILGFDADSEDRIDLIGVSVGSTGTVSGGRLSSTSLQADLAAALNPVLTPGGSVQAYLFDPSSGDLNVAGHRFLVVDLDNNGSFQSSQDLIIDMVNLTGTLGTSDFI
jgi:hypothetical protein